MMGNGGVSFWWQQLGLPSPRTPLPGDRDADVAIVGAGYTGLWAAYYLKKLQPDLRVVVLEQRFAGFGASGRNGGWLTNSVTGGRAQYGREGGARQQAAMNDTVDEVIRVAAAEGIDADIRKGGELNVARTPAQLARLTAAHAEDASWPHTDVELWGPRRTAAHVRVDGALGGLWHPHCARVHPAKLVAGLAAAVERLGVTIHEETTVSRIEPGRAVTDRGTVRATHVLRATEGFTAGLAGQHRTWLPMNSSMIVTAPLPAAVWDEIGWADAATLGDFAHVYMYAQRTADDRIAFGGRGIPYRYGSRVDTDGGTQERTVRALTSLLREFFPARRKPRSTTPGRECSVFRATGRRPWASTPRRVSAGPAATSAPVWRRRTSPAGRWPTSCSAARPTSPPSRGWVDVRAGGRWSPCGGSPSAASMPPTVSPIDRSAGAVR